MISAARGPAKWAAYLTFCDRPTGLTVLSLTPYALLALCAQSRLHEPGQI